MALFTLLLSLATATPDGVLLKRGASCANGHCSAPTAAPKPAPAPAPAHHGGLFKFRLRGTCSGSGCK